MTGFDNQFRTDAFNAQQRQFYDSQRYASERETGRTIAALPGQMQQIAANKQAMELQQMQAELLRVKTESDIRAQEVATETQFQQSKIAQMRMIDELDMSRIGVKSAELGYEQAKFNFEQQKDAAQRAPGQEAKALELKAIGAFGGIANAIRLRRKVPELGEDGTISGWREPTDDEDLDEIAKSLEKRMGAQRHPLLDFKDAGLQAERIAAPYKNRWGIEWPDTPEGKRLKKEYDDLIKTSTEGFRSYFGNSPQSGVDPGDTLEAQGYAPRPMAPRAPQVQGGKGEQLQLSQGVRQQAGYAAQFAQRDQVWSGMAESMGEEAFTRMLVGIGVAADDLVRNHRMPPDRAAQVVMSRILSGGDDAAHYLTMAGYSKDQVRTWLQSRPNATLQTVNAIMERLDKHIQSRRSRKK